MKYASEVIDLLAAYPGKHFRMAEIVRYVDPAAGGAHRQRLRNGIHRVIQALEEHGQVERRSAQRRGGFDTYAWKVPHRLQSESGKVPAIVP